MRRRVEFKEVHYFIFPLVGNICKPRQEAEGDVVSLFNATCEGCGRELDGDDLVVQAWMATRAEAPDGCPGCGHGYFVADVSGLTAEEEDRLTWDPLFARLDVRYENKFICPRCGYRNADFKSTCTRCGYTDDLPEWDTAVSKLYGWCDRCRQLSLLNTPLTSSASKGWWECGDEFCGRVLVGKSGKFLTDRNVFREAWTERERNSLRGTYFAGPRGSETH